MTTVSFQAEHRHVWLFPGESVTIFMRVKLLKNTFMVYYKNELVAIDFFGHLQLQRYFLRFRRFGAS